MIEVSNIPDPSAAAGDTKPTMSRAAIFTPKEQSLREIFSAPSRRQRYLDVEAALALAEAEMGVIPPSAGDKIAAAARLELLDADRMAAQQATTGHFMVPLVSELARIVGEPEGGWVHWGATTQNIQQTGDVVGIRFATLLLTAQLCDVLDALADLGERTATTIMAGRTHWQQAVPITFGFKVAAWSDVMIRHLERLQQLQPRLFTSMTGGAAGTFATLGEVGPAVQEGVARRLGLTPMSVPSRNIVDHFAELVLVLGMVAASATSIAEEVSRLMAVEFGEVSELIPEGDVGSSTMPQKRNPKKSGGVVIMAAQIRALAPLALEAMIQSHEVDGTRSTMMDHAVEQSCILSGDMLNFLHGVITGLEIYPERMKTNLELTGGLISAEAVMIALGRTIGRQEAHEVIHHAAQKVATSDSGISFLDVLSSDPLVTANLSTDEIARFLDPTMHTGLSVHIAQETSARAHSAAKQYRIATNLDNIN